MNNQKESKLSFKNIFQRETKLATYIIVCCTILVLGISYAGDLTFTYQDGNQITSSSKSSCFEPMSDDEAGLYSNNCSYQFSVQNTGSLMGSYTLTLTANASNNAPADQIKVILKRQNAEGILETVESYPKKVSEITNGTLLENGEVNVGESIVYSIQLYVDESTVTDPNVDSGTAYNIDYMINGTATVHENQDISSEVPELAVSKIQKLATSNPDELAYDGTVDNNLRYVGADPNNYVSFNGELWRIIGVMNNIDDGTGTKETRVKIIRDEPIGNYSWDNKASGTGSSDSNFGSNNWSDSALQIVLNSGAYYNRTSGNCPNGNNGATTTCDFSSNGLTEEAKSMIGEVIWSLGGLSSTANTLSTLYASERGSNVYEGRPTTWTGQIGLMYPSDYGYATNGGNTGRDTCLSYNLVSWNNYSDCYNNDWLYESSNYKWTLTPISSFSTDVFDIQDIGGIGATSATSILTVSPVTYLNSNVIITGGDGSHDKPFTLSL